MQVTLGAMLLAFHPQAPPYLTIMRPQLQKLYSDIASLPWNLSPDLFLSQWTTAGIFTLGCMIESNATRTFQDLQHDFGLPTADFYKFLRIQAILSTLLRG